MADEGKARLNEFARTKARIISLEASDDKYRQEVSGRNRIN